MPSSWILSLQAGPGRLRRATLAATLAAGLAGCAQTVVVQPDFPDPLVEPIPLKVGLRYPDQFTDYRYSEDLPNDVDWTFELGEANRALFDKIFNAMFESAEELGDRSPQAAGVDLVIEPDVDALEFSLPRQSRTDQYAVWIRYNLKVTRPDGELVTNWPIAAYGQADSRRFGASKAMALATARAMRDAAATIAADLADKARVEAVLAGEAPGTSSPLNPELINAEAGAEDPDALSGEETLDAS